MVTRCALALVAAFTTVPALAAADDYADDYADDEDESPSFNMFGFQMAAGGVPIDGTDTLAMSLGLALEHPVFKKTRILAEYDWMWLRRRDARTSASANTTVPRPEDHGTGHRATLGFRRELVGKARRHTRAFIDGELGLAVALVNDNMTGAQLVPGAFTGLRAGYDLYSRDDDSPSRTFETALLLRAIALRDGVGLTFGVGMFWGN